MKNTVKDIEIHKKCIHLIMLDLDRIENLKI